MVNETNRETVHTLIAIGLIVVGVIFATMGFFAEPVGEVSNSVIGIVGEFLSLAGALLGIVQYVNNRITKLEDKFLTKEN